MPHSLLSPSLNTSNAYVSLNISLIFLSGNHSLDAELVDDNVAAFSMLTSSFSSSNSVWIICSLFGTVKFRNISSVHVSGVTFYGYNDNRIMSVNYFFLEDSNFIGCDDHKGTALELFKVTARLVRVSFRFNMANKLYYIYQYQG